MIIVQLCAFAGVLVVASALGGLQSTEFDNYIEPMCFSVGEDGLPLVNGQENPLSQTLENFISLAEKFEVANPQLDLKNVLFYFIRNYTYDNIIFHDTLPDVETWSPQGSNFDIVENLWEPDESMRTKVPVAEDPFTNGEKCSLFHMLSHSIILTPRKASNGERSARNSSMRSYGNDFNLDQHYPMEIGVVAVLGTEVAVELGRVLRGLYVGLLDNRKQDVKTFPRIQKMDIDNSNTIQIPTEGREIDFLYALTLAEVISLSTWRPEAGKREKLAPDGRWMSAPIDNDIDTRDICPMIYQLNDLTQSAYSKSSMRGAADGFILGKIGKSLAENRNIRLSQILRMYYSTSGVSGNDKEELGDIRATFCNRLNVIDKLEEKLKDQVALYQLLVTLKYTTLQSNLDFAWNYYMEQKSSIFGTYNQAISVYCSRVLTADKPEDLPFESPLEIIAVMDTSDGAESFKKQQRILGYFAKQLDLRYSGSQMTVLTDQKPTSSTGSKSGIITLNSILTDSASSSCVACSVTQVPSENLGSHIEEDEVILAINQYLKARKENQTNLNGVNGKVVVYFNFRENALTSRPASLQARVDQNLRDLHLNHKDVLVYAVGKSQESVKKFTKNDITFALAADENEDIVAQKLLLKITTAPATLQYTYCKDGRNERIATYEDFISRNAIQHWQMPVQYLYKSKDLKFTFEPQFGPIRVCFSRVIAATESIKKTCHEIQNGQKKDIPQPNPCDKLNEYTCPAFYFSIIGINDTENANQYTCIDTNMQNRCRTTDQIKFKISHEGVRCSGSMAILATPAVILLGIIMHFLSKKY